MAQKKVLSLPVSIRRSWVVKDKHYSLRRQSDLAGVPRTTVQYIPRPASKHDLLLMRLIDEQYLKHPEYGSPRMTDWLHDQGYAVNHKRIERLMRLMLIQAITPGPHTSKPSPGHKIYPYLLRNMTIERVNQVWSTDITYIPMKTGYMYLVAVIDWFSRYVLSWQLSNTLDTSFCIQALCNALNLGNPEIFNTDQGSQFTSGEFTGELLEREIKISMDGRGRALDNVFIERLWWTVKFENIYPRHYADGYQLNQGLSEFFTYYNTERKHSSLDKRTPHEVFIKEFV
jgi:putative transposase